MICELVGCAEEKTKWELGFSFLNDRQGSLTGKTSEQTLEGGKEDIYVDTTGKNLPGRASSGQRPCQVEIYLLCLRKHVQVGVTGLE